MDLVGALVVRFPALKAMLDIHVEAFGETLPHLFVSELFDHLLETSSLPTAENETREILLFLDEAFRAGDDDVENVIAVSFVEYLLDPAEQLDALRRMLPPALASELKRMIEKTPS